MMKIICGPCVIENYEALQKTAKLILEATKNKKIDVTFKSSCIKDNRTSLENYHGTNMAIGTFFLNRIKEEYGFNITTDFHSELQIKEYGNTVDIIQIPAYLAQQTSLLLAAVKEKKIIHIKKPQFLGPVEAQQPFKKLIKLKVPNENIIITDRGTMLGYNQTFMDPRHVTIMKKYAKNVYVDITHPNKNLLGSSLEYAIALAKSYIAAGVDGIFFETHENLESALCDANTMIDANILNYFIEEIYEVWKFFNE